jgi:penicillin-binding protein 2
MFLRDDRPPLPGQFSVRIAVLGAFALIAFSIIFFRLWYLEVLSSDKYLAEAQNNQVRKITVQAPRGEILDRNGEVLVANRDALALQVRTEELPRRPREREEVLREVARVANLRYERIRKQIREGAVEAPATPVTLRRDVPFELIYYIRENQERFPGVSVERIYVRTYPEETLAAHVLGYVREVSAEQLKDPRFQNLDPGDTVGQDGAESSYDSLLRGINGITRVQVDATGRPTGRALSQQQSKAGNNLVLSIDSNIQETGEEALASFDGKPGAFAVLNVNNGEVLGLGSYPTYDPSVFSQPVITQAESEAIFGVPGDLTSTGAPIFNRATNGAYPTGSTFKPITATAAMSSGIADPGTVIYDGGSLTVGDQVFKNAGGAAYGSVDMRTALQVSSDVYFYTLGRDLDYAGDEALQKTAAALGIGSPTGIDLPGEGPGLLPSPEWRDELYRKGQTDRPWSVGDNVNLAVGQGDLQADPLQMAVAYSTIANGGQVVRPHVGLRVEDPSGRVIQQIEPAPRREVEMDPAWRDAIMEGLNRAAMEPGGTSYAIFGGFPIEIAGKTGTAERPPYYDQSWYVALAPYPDPQIAVAVTIEQGGFGVDAAAPGAARILETYFNLKAGQVEPVESTEGAYE